MRWAVRVAAALLLAPAAWAGRPLTVDDAPIVETNGCQLEAWLDRSSDLTRGWLAPACNFGFDTEWQAGFARNWREGDARYSESYAQAKTILREATDAEPWGLGLVLGVTRRPLNEERRGWNHPYLYGIYTQGLCNTSVLFHFNAGWTRDAASRRDFTTWGVAVEGEVRDGVSLLAEAFGANATAPFVRAGARWMAVKDRLAFDLSWVKRPGGARDERFVSVGGTAWTGALR